MKLISYQLGGWLIEEISAAMNDAASASAMDIPCEEDEDVAPTQVVQNLLGSPLLDGSENDEAISPTQEHSSGSVPEAAPGILPGTRNCTTQTDWDEVVLPSGYWTCTMDGTPMWGVDCMWVPLDIEEFVDRVDPNAPQISRVEQINLWHDLGERVRATVKEAKWVEQCAKSNVIEVKGQKLYAAPKCDGFSITKEVWEDFTHAVIGWKPCNKMEDSGMELCWGKCSYSIAEREVTGFDRETVLRVGCDNDAHARCYPVVRYSEGIQSVLLTHDDMAVVCLVICVICVCVIMCAVMLVR